MTTPAIPENQYLPGLLRKPYPYGWAIAGQSAIPENQYLPGLLRKPYPYGWAIASDYTLFTGEDYDTPYLVGGNAPLIWTPGCGYDVGFGWDLFQAVTDFVSNTNKTAGRAVGMCAKSLQDAAGQVADAIKKIPIVGGLVTGIFDLAYHAVTGLINIAVAIAEGKRVDQAILSAIKQTLQDFKQIAPYAQMVISVIPGIGAGLSAALSAGLALAEGQPIGEALKAGLIGALPGGPLVKAAATMGVETMQHALKGEKVDLASLMQTAGGIATSALGLPIAAAHAVMAGVTTMGAIAQGQPLDKAVSDAAIAELPVSDNTKSAMTEATAITLDLAHGKPLDRTLLDRANGLANKLVKGHPLRDAVELGVETAKKLDPGKREEAFFASLQSGVGDSLVSMGSVHLPQDVQKAIKSGVAMGSAAVNQAQKADQLTKKIPGKLVESGLQRAKADPMFGEVRKIAGSKGATRGFDMAAGLLQHQAKTFDLATIRNNLAVPDKLGFDLACAAHIGAVANPKPEGVSPAAHAGHAITMGMQSYQPSKKAIMMQAVQTVPSAAAGATMAVKQVAETRETFIHKIFRALGLTS